MSSALPRRGEIWVANTGDPPKRHWVVIVSLNSRNQNPHAESVLVVPFGGKQTTAITVVKFDAGETGLPGPSYLRGDLIQLLPKARLVGALPRPLSDRRMRQVCLAIRRSFDPDAPASDS